MHQRQRVLIMMEFTKDDHIRRLDKRIDVLESRFNRNFRQIDDSIRTFIDVLEKLEAENKRLLSERDVLIADYNKLIKGAYIDGKKIAPGLVEPIKSKVKNEMDFVRLVARQTLNEKPSDKLYELIILNREVSDIEAARKLNVKESRISQWANELEQDGLIRIKKSGSRSNFVKV